MAARDHIDQALRKLYAERERLAGELERAGELIRLLEAAARELPEETPATPPEPEPQPEPEPEPQPEPEPVVTAPAPPGPYAEMSLIDATLSILRAYGDQHNTDLARILLAGGFRTRATAERFPDTLRMMLRSPKAMRAGIRRSDDRDWTIVEGSE